ncbi:ParE toxin of type II toxin-antitoxin system, parDE [Neomoorella glycerini]|uniref:ParE toxin of type II toxin-antitoxin system, parDE n=1 Tax=Neomoorella glycerini TaxID=55779 RepID=A0A6I5ZS17_9FIRM|nr:type II toxin-antitoxin system RelE/ParE family toxin [Moorella glycerini]QGP92813.1 ParE toxin of type II toxin-antitoxin system, parDE [Moorella glycerini]
MAKHKIVYLAQAQEDLLDIFDYIRRERPQAAERILQLFDKKISHLADFPLMGCRPRDERLKKLGYRVLIVDNYLVFYVVKENMVEIRRVIHGRRRYAFLLQDD